MDSVTLTKWEGRAVAEICDRIGRPPRKRGMDGRWQRADGGEWDWFYALPDDEQQYIRAHHMVAQGIEPDNAAMRHHEGDVDAWADDWLRAIRTVRRHRVSVDEWTDAAVDEWGEEPEPDEGDVVVRALTHVVAGASLSAHEADALVQAVAAAQGAGTVPAMLGAADVARVMGVKVATIRQWRARGKMPTPSVVLGDRPAWKRTVIEQWAEGCKVAAAG